MLKNSEPQQHNSPDDKLLPSVDKLPILAREISNRITHGGLTDERTALRVHRILFPQDKTYEQERLKHIVQNDGLIDRNGDPKDSPLRGAIKHNMPITFVLLAHAAGVDSFASEHATPLHSQAELIVYARECAVESAKKNITFDPNVFCFDATSIAARYRTFVAEKDQIISDEHNERSLKRAFSTILTTDGDGGSAASSVMHTPGGTPSTSPSSTPSTPQRRIDVLPPLLAMRSSSDLFSTMSGSTSSTPEVPRQNSDLTRFRAVPVSADEVNFRLSEAARSSVNIPNNSMVFSSGILSGSPSAFSAAKAKRASPSLRG